MNTRFGLFCAAAVVMFVHTAKAVDPEVKITKTNYVAANGSNPAKANPEGTWKKPAGLDHKVIWDYGTLVGNTYTLDQANGAPEGGTKQIGSTDESGSWGPKTAADNLPNPIPANYVVRVRLMKAVTGGTGWEEVKKAYAAVPPATEE